MDYQVTQKSSGVYEFQYFKPFDFKSGGQINPLTLAYKTYGKLSAGKDNAILIHHALSTDSHLVSDEQNPQTGWWEQVVGSGKAVDTDKFFVICINNLGSCFGSSGPASIHPQTHKPYRLDFPKVTIEDMVNSQQLLIARLGIKQLYAVIGNSMGAMLSLCWAIQFPDQVKRLISVSSCYRAFPVSTAYHIIQKEIICLDPEWQQGYYQKNPAMGLKIARKVGLVSYRDAQDLNLRFIENENIAEYLDYNANKLAVRFDANSYMYLLDAMDDFDVTRGFSDKSIPFKKISAKTLIISVDSDVLFPPMQQKELYEQFILAGHDAAFSQVHSNYGHDAFYADMNIANTIHHFLEESI